MTKKKEIDRLRESAGRIKVGDGSDGAITGMMTISNRLYIIKEKAIYVIAMADEIDPKRTRADIPNMQQIVVDAGSGSEIVRRILLTARELFRKDRLLEPIDWNAVLIAALELLRDVLAAQEIAEEYAANKRAAEAKVTGLRPE